MAKKSRTALDEAEDTYTVPFSIVVRLAHSQTYDE